MWNLVFCCVRNKSYRCLKNNVRRRMCRYKRQKVRAAGKKSTNRWAAKSLFCLIILAWSNEAQGVASMWRGYKCLRYIIVILKERQHLRELGEDNFVMDVNGGSVTITIRSASSGWCVTASHWRKCLLPSMTRHLHQISSRCNTCVAVPSGRAI